MVNFIAHGISKIDAESEVPENETSDNASDQPQPKESALQKYATNLNEQARNGHIDPLVGREHEVERVIQILCRRRKNNPLLVGESGVRSYT